MDDNDNKTDDLNTNDDTETVMTPDTTDSDNTEETSVADAPAMEEAENDAPAEEAPVAEEQPSSGGSSTAQPAGTDDRGRQLYNVKCSNCGNDTTVPFQPTEGRPVYCRDCFVKMRDNK